ncbi:phospholipase A2 inhibitor NAI-like [Hyperolius riggenbachi]|uniref:phospholipase A2 inhibitor NAI-like n=1 Tax=Hyperolius riggenbachi TaxID=752182 RepID=UPI0035A27B8B
MSSVLGFLCVLSAFTATGFSLSCKVCMGPDASSCYGSSETCPPENACGAVRTVTKTNGNQVNEQFSISCTPVKQCSTPGSISLPYGKILRGTSCCYTSHCVPPTPLLPADDQEANGLYCGTCMTTTSNYCTAEERMACMGKEDMCLLQTSVSTGAAPSQEAFRGCSTKTYCDLLKQSVKSETRSIELTHTCTPGENQTLTDPGNSSPSNYGHYLLGPLISGLVCLNLWSIL